MGFHYPLPKEAHPDFATPGRKPVGPVKFNFGNRVLGNNLQVNPSAIWGTNPTGIAGNAGFWVCQGNGFINTVTGQRQSMDYTGTTKFDRNSFVTDGTQSASFPVTKFSTTQPWTMVVDCIINAGGTMEILGYCEAVGSATYDLQIRRAGSFIEGYTYTSGGPKTVTGNISVPTTGARVTVLATCTDGTFDLYQNGQKAGTLSTGVSDTHYGGYATPIFSLADSSPNPFTGEILAFGMFAGFATEAQGIALTRDLYGSLLTPAIPMTYFTAAAAGGRIMGAIAGQGGLAGHGGLAGPGGGLAG